MAPLDTGVCLVHVPFTSETNRFLHIFETNPHLEPWPNPNHNFGAKSTSIPNGAPADNVHYAVQAVLV